MYTGRICDIKEVKNVIQKWRERHRANTRKRVVGGRGERKDGDKERGNMVEKEKEREKE